MMHLSSATITASSTAPMADQFMADVKKYLENWNEEIG